MASGVETSFSPTSPHFFAIVLHQTLLNNRLIIPKRIVKKCGSTLKDDVLLKLPCGSEWKLGLTKSVEGKVWIDKGWVEFAKHYSIAKGHLLLLRYDGNSRFNVVIFDTTTTEIDYPLKKRVVKEAPKHDNPVKEEEISGDEDDPSSSKAMKSGKSTMSTNETARSNGFESKHPYFKLVIQPSHVGTGCNISIPSYFAKLHLCTSKRVVLKNPDGRSWPVNYKVYNSPHRGRFVTGWSVFARENGLKIGDACVFNMVKSIRTVLFEVSFFRGNGVADLSSFESEIPFFSVYMHASYIKLKSLRIPTGFAHTYMKKSQSEVRLCVSDGRSWYVRYLTSHESTGRRKHCFSNGWHAFIKGSGLKEGDICTFKLINKDVFSFEVRIVKPIDKKYKQMCEAIGPNRTKPWLVNYGG